MVIVAAVYLIAFTLLGFIAYDSFVPAMSTAE